MPFLALIFLLLQLSCSKIESLPFLPVDEGGNSCKNGIQNIVPYLSPAQRGENKVSISGTPQTLSIMVDRKCILESSADFSHRKLLAITYNKNYKRYSSFEFHSLPTKNFNNLSKALEYFKIDSCILSVSEDKLFYPLAALPNDPKVEDQSYLFSIAYPEVYSQAFTGSANLKQLYTVAVIDLGFWLEHPDLQSQWWVNLDEIPSNGVDDDANGVIDDIHGSHQATVPAGGDPSSISYQTHGTHVSGFIGAASNNNEGISGIMGPNVKIMAINTYPKIVGGPQQGTFGSTIANSIIYATDNGANVINISMGTEGIQPSLEEALLYAVSKNVTVVVAAGNNSKELSDNFKFIPAYYAKNIEGVVAVAATNSANNNVSPPICNFSNYSSSFVEIAAPGCDLNTFTSYGGHGILSAVDSGISPSLYGFIQGTSMASPIAAAAAMYAYATMKEYYGLIPTSAMVEDAIVNGSKINANLNGSVKNNKHINLKSISTYIDSKYKTENCK
jgi:hypothetical protein